MKLTGEQRKFLQYDKSTLLVACPGSGKTRVIIAKLLRCIDEFRETPRKVACITYTNAAVYEIENRIKQYGETGDEDRCEISTIHSFCLNNILRNFYWKLPECSEGISVLPNDSDEYAEIVNEILRDYGLANNVRENFPQLNRLPDGSPIPPPPLNEEIALEFWQRLGKRGFIDYPNIVYLSYKILSQNQYLADGIGARFPWILLDEFQDTSALQVEILSLIARSNRTRFSCVGDPYQSIYGFAGAEPSLMAEFSRRTKASGDFKLSGNFRCSQNIVEHAERLLPRVPRMKAVGEFSKFSVKPQYIHANTAFEAVQDYFLPVLQANNIGYGQSAILAPSWFNLLPLGRKLREYGVPIVGPGARPYRGSRLVVTFIEQLCAYVEEPTPDKIRPVERELHNLLLQVTDAHSFRIFTYDGRRTVMRLLRSARSIRERYEGAVQWLNSAIEEFARILLEDEFLSILHTDLLFQSVQDVLRDMQRNNIDLDNLAVSDLGVFANPTMNMKLLTIHGAKGREFDGVAIMGLHEGQIPNWRARTGEEIDEYRRQLYVGMTRAKRILMYITDNERARNQPSRFLGRGELDLIP